MGTHLEVSARFFFWGEGERGGGMILILSVFCQFGYTFMVMVYPMPVLYLTVITSKHGREERC